MAPCSTVLLCSTSYEAVFVSSRTTVHKALALFNLADLFVHEVAHAANKHLRGKCPEDFCEQSRIAGSRVSYEKR